MKPVQRVAIAGSVLLLTYSFTRLWLGSAWAELVWSQLNQWIDSGENPGLSSDIELVVSILVALLLSSAAVLLLIKAFKRARGERANLDLTLPSSGTPPAGPLR
jgi:heme A synthase